MAEPFWLQHYPDDVDWRMRFSPQPLFALLDHAANRFPSHTAIEFLGRKIRYQDLILQVGTMAAHLQAMGVGKGVHVGILLPNCPAFIISFYAILKAGGTVVQFNPLYASAEIIHQARDARVQMLIAPNLRTILDRTLPILSQAGIEQLLLVDFSRQLPWWKGALFRRFRHKEIASIPAASYLTPWEKLLEPPPKWLKPVDVDPMNDIAVLQYTGGTTGTPKGAMLTHANLHSNCMQSMAWVASDLKAGEERFMGVLPLFHVFAMTTVMNLGLALGAEIILQPRFDLPTLLKALKRQRPTAMPAVPALYAAVGKALEKAPETFPKSLKACISGGAALPAAVREQFEAITGAHLVEGYGLTEASPVCSCNPLKPKHGTPHTPSIGLPFPGTSITIRALEAPYPALPEGEIGEICVSGPQIMRGYWQKPEETAATFHHDADGTRWLRTGDLGLMRADGYIELVDRLKELIITNGYNVYPRYIEEALYRHPAIADCAVLGEADTQLGERVVAYIVLKDTASALDERAIRQHLEPQVARYALPKRYVFVDELPRSILGKTLKRQLKEAPHG